MLKVANALFKRHNMAMNDEQQPQTTFYPAGQGPDQAPAPQPPVAPAVPAVPAVVPSPTQAPAEPAPSPELSAPISPDGIAPVDSSADTSNLMDDDDLVTVEAEADDEVTGDDPSMDAFSWQASEYIHHDKGFGWYLILLAVVLGLLVIAYFTHQWLAIGVFVTMFAALVVYARKPPRTLTYQIDQTGITIEDKHFPFSHFRSFGLIQDISWHAIDLEPTQRFMPRLTILFQDQDFDPIVAHLSAQLPRLDHQPDMVEKAARYLKF